MLSNGDVERDAENLERIGDQYEFIVDGEWRDVKVPKFRDESSFTYI